MLGIDDSAIPWLDRKMLSIVWKSKEPFQSELGATIEDESSKLRQTVEEFKQRGLLSPAEADAITPKLVVTIRYSESVSQQP